MQVAITYFAACREMTGISNETVTTRSQTLEELFREAMVRHPGLAHEPAALVAVNDEMAEWHGSLSDGDQVLFFPPVAGG